MRLCVAGVVLIAAMLVASAGGLASPLRDPGACPRDSKLLNDGPTAVFGDGPGTWWGVIVDGMVEAGLDTPAEQIAYLNGVFGTSYDNLADLQAFNLQLVSDGFDKNQNDYVCAYDLRGTRAYNDDPFASFTLFGISDDKIR